MEREAWQAAVRGAAKSRTRPSDGHYTMYNTLMNTLVIIAVLSNLNVPLSIKEIELSDDI